jgi:hypothetical protein
MPASVHSSLEVHTCSHPWLSTCLVSPVAGLEDKRTTDELVCLDDRADIQGLLGYVWGPDW